MIDFVENKKEFKKVLGYRTLYLDVSVGAMTIAIASGSMTYELAKKES